MSRIAMSRHDNAVINRTSSESTFDDIYNHIVDNVELFATLNVVWDLSDFNFDDITSDDLRIFVRRSEKMSHGNPHRKTALVSISDLGYGMLRVLDAISFDKYGFISRVFRNVEDALKWFNEDDESVLN